MCDTKNVKGNAKCAICNMKSVLRHMYLKCVICNLNSETCNMKCKIYDMKSVTFKMKCVVCNEMCHFQFEKLNL